MASPQEIQQLLDRLERVYRDLGKENPFKNWDSSVMGELANQSEILTRNLSDAQRELSEINGDLNETIIGFHKMVDEIKNTNSGLALSTKTMNGMNDIARKLKYDQAGISELSKKELETLKKQYEQKRNDLTISKDLLASSIRDLENKRASEGLSESEARQLQQSIASHRSVTAELGKEDNLTGLINGRLNQRIAKEERLNELMGLGGAAVSSVKTALDKLGFGALGNALGFDKVQAEMEAVAKEIEAAGGNVDDVANKQKVLNAGITAAKDNFKKALRDPAAQATFFIKEMIAALKLSDKSAGELAKSMGTSYDEAMGMRQELGNIAGLSFDANINTQNLQKSMMALNKEFGTATMMSGELLTDYTKLTEVAGYSAEAAAGLSRITVATGTDLSENTEQILGQAMAFNATNKLALNEKEIVEGVAKASKATTLTLGMQPGKIAQAVAQSKALGVELSKVEDIAGQLLNFESSISNELEAELLTGKDLNLETARLAALNGDIATVAKEIKEQVGGAADFTKMNVIQQEALAKSVGMTREDLAASLIEQEALSKLGAKDAAQAKEKFDKLVAQYGYEQAVKELGDEKYAQQLKSQSIQEKFNATVEKLRETFVQIADAVNSVISPIVDVLMPILSVIQGIVGGIGTAMGWVGEQIGKIIPNLGILGSFLKWIAKLGVVYAGYKAFSSLASIPVVGYALGAAAAAGTIGLGMSLINGISKGDDVMSEGYGKRTLLAGKDAIALNNDDTVIAGTDLFGKKKGKKDTESTPTQSAPSIDITPLIDRMSAVEGVLQQILAKETNIYLDSTKVGTGFAMASSKVQ